MKRDPRKIGHLSSFLYLETIYHQETICEKRKTTRICRLIVKCRRRRAAVAAAAAASLRPIFAGFVLNLKINFYQQLFE